MGRRKEVTLSVAIRVIGVIEITAAHTAHDVRFLPADDDSLEATLRRIAADALAAEDDTMLNAGTETPQIGERSQLEIAADLPTLTAELEQEYLRLLELNSPLEYAVK
jgi:hypothetical protein